MTKLRVLVTRPTLEAKNLIASLEAHCFVPISLPAIEIYPIDNSIATEVALLTAAKVIFSSRNAVKNVANVALTALQKFSGSIFAIGSSTAAELYALNIGEIIYPPNEFNSEALLDLPELEQVLDEHIVIFSGIGGRDLLAHTLIDRGADVTKIATYERRSCDYTATAVNTALQRLVCIISTSSESLQNLIQLAHKAAVQRLLFSTPLLVVSKNMLELARTSGFSSTVMVAPKPTDAAIVDSLCKWIGTAS